MSGGCAGHVVLVVVLLGKGLDVRPATHVLRDLRTVGGMELRVVLDRRTAAPTCLEVREFVPDRNEGAVEIVKSEIRL